ncbi:MAG: hypothetical protein ACYTFW_01415 [Planctomycetota bacterium]|jgi:hypothetical protein
MLENEKFDKPARNNPDESPPCCGPTSGQSDCCSPGSGGSKSFKTAIFVVVILLACAVAAHSLLTKGNRTANTSPPTESFRADLASLALFNSEGAEQKAVFILLADESGGLDEKTFQQTEQAASRITSKGTPIGTVTIDSKSDDYALLTKNFSIDSFPSVVIMVKGAGSAVVSGQITEARLLEAFVEASTAGPCCPGSDPSCCPK